MIETLAEAQLMRQEKAESYGDKVSRDLSRKLLKAARIARRSKKDIFISEKFKDNLEKRALEIVNREYQREFSFNATLGLADEIDIDLGNLKKSLRTTTGRLLRRNIETLTDKINASIRTIVKQDLSESKSIKLLNKRLKVMGLSVEKTGVVQVWIRTAISISVNTARWAATRNNPNVWGYQYVTMRDDRVRPAHKELEGYTRKKEDPDWLIIWPPNSWNCRCQTVALLEKQRQSRKIKNISRLVDEEFIGVPILL